jgi:hypothetical protein
MKERGKEIEGVEVRLKRGKGRKKELNGNRHIYI